MQIVHMQAKVPCSPVLSWAFSHFVIVRPAISSSCKPPPPDLHIHLPRVSPEYRISPFSPRPEDFQSHHSLTSSVLSLFQEHPKTKPALRQTTLPHSGQPPPLVEALFALFFFFFAGKSPCLAGNMSSCEITSLWKGRPKV